MILLDILQFPLKSDKISDTINTCVRFGVQFQPNSHLSEPKKKFRRKVVAKNETHVSTQLSSPYVLRFRRN